MGSCPSCKQEFPSLRYCPYHGLPLECVPEGIPSHDLSGSVIAGSYRVLSKIGVGGMGSVYKVEHLRLGKLMAMKVLHGDYTSLPEAVKRFHREARWASRLQHPHCIELTDYGRAEDGRLFMVMEYLLGQDLFEMLRDEHLLSPERTVNIVRQVAAGLAEAHRHHVIHRDLKPENIFLCVDREFPEYVKLLDFGIAKLLEHGPEDPSITDVGRVFGTPEYLSPEQASGERIDHRADLYSLGVVMYRMLTGRLPFMSSSKVKLILAHRDETPPRFGQLSLQQELPGELEAVVFKLLAKDRGRRYQTADELQMALEQLMRTVPRDPAGNAIEWLEYR